MDILLLIAVLFVAAANGANDNFKGVATLYGSGVAGYRVSLAWACITTLGGSLCSAFLATALLQEFTGACLSHLARIARIDDPRLDRRAGAVACTVRRST